MRERLLDKFILEHTALEKEEMNTKHNFGMLIQDLTAQKDQAIADSMERSEMKAKTLQAKADVKGPLRDTTTIMEADKTCRADSTESRQQLHAEELEANAKAIEIILSSAVQGNADEH
eukprot:16013310-Heterocapsa_arctica.AAC.1